MKRYAIAAFVGAFSMITPAAAQEAAAEAGYQITLPANSLVEATPANEITSVDMKEGTTRDFIVVRDVTEQGVVIIPRGSLVTAEVTWRTGKGIVGKSAKFELTFRSVRAAGRDWPLRGMYRQEGRGNTVGALIGAAIITGKSAVMYPGQIVNAFTIEPMVLAVTPTKTPPMAVSERSVARPASAPARQQIAPGVRCVTCR